MYWNSRREYLKNKKEIQSFQFSFDKTARITMIGVHSRKLQRSSPLFSLRISMMKSPQIRSCFFSRKSRLRNQAPTLPNLSSTSAERQLWEFASCSSSTWASLSNLYLKSLKFLRWSKSTKNQLTNNLCKKCLKHQKRMTVCQNCSPTRSAGASVRFWWLMAARVLKGGASVLNCGGTVLASWLRCWDRLCLHWPSYIRSVTHTATWSLKIFVVARQAAATSNLLWSILACLKNFPNSISRIDERPFFWATTCLRRLCSWRSMRRAGCVTCSVSCVSATTSRIMSCLGLNTLMRKWHRIPVWTSTSSTHSNRSDWTTMRTSKRSLGPLSSPSEAYSLISSRSWRNRPKPIQVMSIMKPYWTSFQRISFTKGVSYRIKTKTNLKSLKFTCPTCLESRKQMEKILTSSTTRRCQNWGFTMLKSALTMRCSY